MEWKQPSKRDIYVGEIYQKTVPFSIHLADNG